MELSEILINSKEALQINPDACFCSLTDANNLCKAQCLKLLEWLKEHDLLYHGEDLERKTFRQEVEEILQDGCRECQQGRVCEQCKEDTDRICSAAKRMGERMTKTVIADVQKEKHNELANPFAEEARKTGIALGIHKCQAHIAKETEG